MKKSLLPRDYAIGLFVAALGFVLLAVRTAPGVLPGDSGEFQFVPYVWGVPHPTGYPLYVLLGGVWSHLLPIRSVAFRMNLFSALWGSLTLGALYLLIVASLGPGETKHERWAVRAGGLVGVLLLLASDIFQRQSMVAEVYTMHHFLALLILLAALRWTNGRHMWGSVWLALALGLGLVHHRSTILLIPGLLVAWAVRPRARIRWKTALAALAMPLLLYLFIPLRAPHLSYLRLDLGPAGSWRLYDPTLTGFLKFVSGSRFAGEIRSVGDAARQLPAAWKLLLSQTGWGGMLLAAVGIAALAVRRRWRALSLLLIGLIAITVFDAFYGIGDIRDFYGTAVVLLTALAGIGVAYLARMSPRGTALPVTAALLALCFFLHPFKLMDLHCHDETAQRWQRILASPLPDDAVLVTNDRDEIVPLYYYQLVEKKRTSWQPMYPLIVPEMDDVVEVLEISLRSGRPVYAIKRMDELSLRFDLEAAFGDMEKVRPMPEPAEALPGGLRVGPLEAVGITKRRAGSALRVDVYWRVTGPVPAGAKAYVHLLNGSGEKIAQGRDYEPGWPYHPPQEWRVGETVRVTQAIPVPSGRSAGALLLGWYTSEGQIGAPVRLPLE